MTFDIDWASDEIISFTLDILEKAGVKATFFWTHKTPIIDRVKKSTLFELGIHPNFNFLLNGDSTYGSTAVEVLRYYRDIIPDAETIRSHSMLQSAYLLNMFANQGFRFDCNLYLQFDSGFAAKPFLHTDRNMTRVPVAWEDDIACLYHSYWDVEKVLEYPGIKVFNFHPIHIFLNSRQPDQYERCKSTGFEHSSLQACINTDSYGTKCFLLDLISRTSP